MAVKKFSDLVQDVNPAPKITSFDTISDILTKGGINLVNLIFFFIGMIFFVNLILAAWEYINSSGDKNKIQAATTRLLHSFLGIAVALASFLIIRIITAFIGLSKAI